MASGPDDAAISPPAPNPFNPEVRLRYQLPYRSKVEVAVFDVAGRKVATLFSGEVEAGAHDLSWNGRDDGQQGLPSGVYFARVQFGRNQLVHKLILMK